jgi:hypothetical protein
VAGERVGPRRRRLTIRLRHAIDRFIGPADGPLDRATTGPIGHPANHGDPIMTILLRRTLVLAGVAILLAVAALGAARASSSATPVSAVPPVAAVAADAPAPTDASAPDAISGGDLPTALGAALGPDLDAILSADQTKTKPAVAAVRLRRLAAWQRLVHATVVVDLKQGGLTTIQLDHGTISAVSATTLTIKETGGGSVTVALGDKTRVRRDGAKAAIADLKTADDVFVLSKVETGGTTGYLVVVPRT